MTTTTLRYNGRAFIYAPTSLVARDFEGHGNVYAKEPRMELAGPDWALTLQPSVYSAHSQ